MNLIITLGAVSAVTAVAAGAYGAHSVPDVDLAALFATGVDYHMWHSLGLIACGLWFQMTDEDARARRFLLIAASLLFLIGIILFPGTLYAKGVTGENPFPALTPKGGMALMGGWIAMAVAGLVRGRG